MKVREFVRKSQFPLAVALGTYPLVVILEVFSAPELMPYGWVFPAVYAALAIIMLALPRKLRMLFCVCGALFLALSCRMFPHNQNVALLIGILYAVLLLCSLRISNWEAHKELPGSLMCACVIIGLTGCFLATFGVEFQSAAREIRFSFVSFVLLSLLSMNRGSLNLAAGDNWSFTVPMRRKNLLLTVGMFAIALGLAAIPHVYDLLAAALRWIVQLIRMPQNAFVQPEETTQQVVETTVLAVGENWREVLLEGVETKRTPEQVYIIMTVIALVVTIPLVSVVLYRLGKWLLKKMQSLIDLLERTTNIQQVDFVDEITDTREEAQHERSRKKKQRKQSQWLRNMTPAERIRYRYRRLRTKHPEWRDYETVRENLPEDVAELYERARYSEHPVTAQEAQRFQNETKYNL